MTRCSLSVLSSGVTQCNLCAPLGKTRFYFGTTPRRHPEAYELLAKDGVSASSELSAAAATRVQSAVAEGEGLARLLIDERDVAAATRRHPEAYELLAKDGVSASSEHSASAAQSAVAEGEGSARLLRGERGAAAAFLKKPGGDSSDDYDDGCRGKLYHGSW